MTVTILHFKKLLRFATQEIKQEPKPLFWINLRLNYAIDSFLRRIMKPSKPKPVNNMAYISGSGTTVTS